MIHHAGRKLRKSTKRLLKASRSAGRRLAQGTGYARKLIGKVDSFTGGMASQTLRSTPYGKVALKGLAASESAGKMMRHPQKTLRDRGFEAMIN